MTKQTYSDPEPVSMAELIVAISSRREFSNSSFHQPVPRYVQEWTARSKANQKFWLYCCRYDNGHGFHRPPDMAAVTEVAKLLLSMIAHDFPLVVDRTGNNLPAVSIRTYSSNWYEVRYRLKPEQAKPGPVATNPIVNDPSPIDITSPPNQQIDPRDADPLLAGFDLKVRWQYTAQAWDRSALADHFTTILRYRGHNARMTILPRSSLFQGWVYAAIRFWVAAIDQDDPIAGGQAVWGAIKDLRIAAAEYIPMVVELVDFQPGDPTQWRSPEWLTTTIKSAIQTLPHADLARTIHAAVQAAADDRPSRIVPVQPWTFRRRAWAVLRETLLHPLQASVLVPTRKDR